MSHPEPRVVPASRIAALVVVALLITGAVAFLLVRAMNGGGDAPPSPGTGGVVPPVDPAPWTDVHWARVRDDNHAMSGPLGQRLENVVVGPRGLVASGSTSVGMPGSETSIGTIWTSETGERWRPIVLDAGGQPGDVATVNRIAGGPRGIVAWGTVCCSVERPAAWWSLDGDAWERVALPAAFDADHFVSSVEAGPDGFVAVGSDGGRAGIWVSPDGRRWTGADAAAAGLVRGTVFSVARDDRGWIAAGQRDDRPTHDGAIWRSPDLASWRQVADQAPLSGPDEVELASVVPFAAGYLLTGNLGSHEERVRCEQQQGLATGRIAMGAQFAFDCGWGMERHWWSADGEEWQVLPPIHEQPGQPPLPVTRADGRGLIGWGVIRAGGPGLVTIGYEVAGRNGPNDVTAIWTSPDGRTWRPVGAAPQFAPNAYPSGFAILGRQIVAVGSADAPQPPTGVPQGSTDDGAVWIGSILP